MAELRGHAFQKRYAEGKCTFLLDCEVEDQEALEECICEGIVDVQTLFDLEKYKEAMRGKGFSDEKVERYSEAFRMIDETYLVKPRYW